MPPLDRTTIIKRAVSAPANVDPIEASVTVEDIANIQPQTTDPYQQQIYDQIRKYNSAIPVQARSTYFPAADTPILKGTYSGSIVGSVPIFAPTELVPYGVFDAKQQALKDAAQAKVKELEDFNALFAKAPETKRKAVQEQLDSGYFNWLQGWEETAKKRYGQDWTSYLRSDTQFLKEQQSWNTLAQYNSQLVDQVAELDALVKTGNFNASPETMRSRNAVLTGVDNLAVPGSPEAGALSQNILRFTADYDLDKAVNTELDKLIQDTYESYPGVNANGIYDILVSTKTTGTDKNKIDMLTDSLYDTRYAGSGYITRDMVKRNIEAKLGKKVERTVQTQANQFSGSDGSADIYSDKDINESSQFNVTNANEQGANISPVTSFYGVTFDKKPIVTNTAKGETMTDLATGSTVKATGSEMISWGETKVVPVQKGPNGELVIVSDKNAKNEWHGTGAGQWEYKVMAVGSYKVPETDALGNVKGYKTVTVAKPADELKNALVSEWNADGTVKRGIPIDKQNQKAQELNAQKQQAPKGNAPTSKPAPYGSSVVQDGVTYVWNGNEYVPQ